MTKIAGPNQQVLPAPCSLIHFSQCVPEHSNRWFEDHDPDDDPDIDVQGDYLVIGAPRWQFRTGMEQYLGHDALFFHAGSDKLNPLPCFAVCWHPESGLVSGWVGGIVHT